MTYPPKDDLRHTEPFIKNALRITYRKAALWLTAIAICCTGLYLVLHGAR